MHRCPRSRSPSGRPRLRRHREGVPNFLRSIHLVLSWASGTLARSDIDIGVQGPPHIRPVTLQAIRAACEALPTLFTIDLVDLAVLPPTVQRRITVFGQALARFDEALARPEDPIWSA